MFDVLKIDYEEHTLYHRTEAIIEKLDEKFLSVETKWHSNGSMGLWCSTLPHLCCNFGKNCYEVNLKESAKRVGWKFEEFVKFCENRLDRFSYQDLREYCLASGIDVIYLVEWRPVINEVIVINYGAVESINLVDCPGDKTFYLHVEDQP